MRLGIMLPTFQDSYSRVLDTARYAEECNLDGAFCYDHIWPIGHPGEPAFSCFPLLGAIAASTSRLTIGTLVARVGLYAGVVQGTDMLIHSFEALHAIAPGRVIAGIGSGDSRSTPEDSAYGIESGPAESRRSLLRDAARSLAGRGLETWVGLGASASALRTGMILAASTGASINVWQADPSKIKPIVPDALIPREGEHADPLERATEMGNGNAHIASYASNRAAGNVSCRKQSVPITWAGSLDLLTRTDLEGKQGVTSYAEALSLLARSGITWAVCAGIDAALLAEAARVATGNSGN
ncbi:MAG: LLM class flavin-dependent oxidoreductase [Actinobacteria bacterium]|nr:LLM class flavin-dependent oxidoreductase [Actinomycetota bacterium]MCL5447222.1 LLM class flavin-dependent oxidoreductase [Actinomycetota bacterium]